MNKKTFSVFFLIVVMGVFFSQPDNDSIDRDASKYTVKDEIENQNLRNTLSNNFEKFVDTLSKLEIDKAERTDNLDASIHVKPNLAEQLTRRIENSSINKINVSEDSVGFEGYTDIAQNHLLLEKELLKYEHLNGEMENLAIDGQSLEENKKSYESDQEVESNSDLVDLMPDIIISIENYFDEDLAHYALTGKIDNKYETNTDFSDISTTIEEEYYIDQDYPD